MTTTVENVKVTLKKISSELDDVEHRREALIKGTRGVIINCSKSIMALHRGRYEEAAKLLDEAQADLGSLRTHVKGDLERYLLSAEQELVEAYQLKRVYEKTPLAGIEELHVSTSSYLLGLLDSIGEIKRMIYDNLQRTLRRAGDVAAGGDKAPWDSRGGQPRHHDQAWPREAALSQSGADPSDRRAVDQEIRARQAHRAQRVETATGEA